MLLPEQIISSLEEDVQKYFRQEKSIDYHCSDKISTKYDLNEKTRRSFKLRLVAFMLSLKIIVVVRCRAAIIR